MEVLKIGARRFLVPILGEQEDGTNKKKQHFKKGDPNPYLAQTWYDKSEEYVECTLGKAKPRDKEVASKDKKDAPDMDEEEPTLDDDSYDDDLLDYWVTGEKTTSRKESVTITASASLPLEDVKIPQPELMSEKSTQNKGQASELANSRIGAGPTLSHTTSMNAPTVISSPNYMESYSHVLLLPLDDVSGVKKRVDAFRKKVCEEKPALDKYFATQKIYLPILYLSLNGEQLDTLLQIISIPELITTDKRKPKIELQGTFFYCDDNSKNAKKASCVYTTIKKNEEAAKLEDVVHKLVEKMIDFGVSTPDDLANCKMDLSANRYRVDHWRLNLLKDFTDGRAGNMDASHIFASTETKDFFFGAFDLNQIALCKTDKTLTQQGLIKL